MVAEPQQVQQPSVESTTQEITQPMVEENQVVQPSTEKSTDTQLGDATTPTTNQEGIVNPPEDKGTSTDLPDASKEISELKRQLEEYKIKEEEILNLSSRLGTNQTQDIQLIQAQQQLDIINNQAQQAYIELCNAHNVDYRPEKITQSANELLEKDPRAYYDLQYKLNQLDAAVNAKRGEVNSFIREKQTQAAIAQYNEIMTASPALSQALNSYLATAGDIDPNAAVTGFMDTVQPLYKEAFEMGRLYAQQQAELPQQQTPAEVLNTSSMANQSTFNPAPQRTFTREEIANMSQQDFEKYEKEIDRQAKAGLIK